MVVTGAAAALVEAVLEVRVAVDPPRRRRPRASSPSGARPRLVWMITPVALMTRPEQALHELPGPAPGVLHDGFALDGGTSLGRPPGIVDGRPGDRHQRGREAASSEGGQDAVHRGQRRRPASVHAPGSVRLSALASSAPRARVRRIARGVIDPGRDPVRCCLPRHRRRCALATYLFMPLPATLPEERPQADSRVSTVYAADESPIGEFREAETRVVIDKDQIPDVDEASGHRRRGPRVLRARGRRLAGHRPGALCRRAVPEPGAGRVHHHSAAGEEPLHRWGTDGRPQGQGSPRRRPGGAGPRQGRDPGQVPQHRVHGRLGLRRGGGRSVLLPQGSQGPQPLRGGTAGRGAARPQPLLAPQPSRSRRVQAATWSSTPSCGAKLATPEEVKEARGREAQDLPASGRGGPLPVLPRLPARVPPRREGLLARPASTGAGSRSRRRSTPRSRTRRSRSCPRPCPTPKDPEASLVSVEPQTGFVRALVGGRNWDAVEGQPGPRASWAAGSGRQAGSAFKPFVLARALDAGVSPNKVYSAPVQRPAPWVHQAGGQLRGRLLRVGHHRQGDAQVDQHRLRPADRRRRHQGDGGDGQAPRDHQHRPRTSRSTAASPSAPRRSRPSTWRPPSRCSPPGASGPSPPRSCGSPTRTAVSSRTTPSPSGASGCSRSRWPTT